MKIKDRVYVKRRYDAGYWAGEIHDIVNDIAIIWGTDFKRNSKGFGYGMAVRKKLKEEDMMYKQRAYWEK